MGDDQENTRQILADLIQHPNAGGVLVLGLGCENSNIDVLKNYLNDYDPERVKFLVAQEHEDEIQDSLDIIANLADVVSQDKREEIDSTETFAHRGLLRKVCESSPRRSKRAARPSFRACSSGPPGGALPHLVNTFATGIATSHVALHGTQLGYGNPGIFFMLRGPLR